MTELSKYDALFKGISGKLQPLTFTELNDMMSVVALFNNNPSEQEIDFINKALALYLLDVCKVKFDSNILKDHKKEIQAMLKAMHNLRRILYNEQDTEAFKNYANSMAKQNKKYEA